MDKFAAPTYFRVNGQEPVLLDAALHVFKDGEEVVTIIPADFTAMPSRRVVLEQGDKVLVEFYHRWDCEVPAAETTGAPQAVLPTQRR